jgi:hypothetical protein
VTFESSVELNMINLGRRIVPWFRRLTDREPMDVELSPEARLHRLASKGLFFARLDRPAVPKGRRASRRDVGVSPLLTAALYGPSDAAATKLVLSFIPSAGGDIAALERWFADDVLGDENVLEGARAFLHTHPAAGLTMTGGTIGCAHEEGKDYPVGADCPQCPFWKGKQ